MARQSATPKPAVHSRPRRRFTLVQANSTLPLVRRIVGDIVRTHGVVSRLHRRLEIGSIARKQQDLQAELERAVEKLQDLVDELSAVGCELKDFPTGLVDFIGRHQGRDICLCWKLGEEHIDYWHELQAGFAGRQPVSTLQETD